MNADQADQRGSILKIGVYQPNQRKSASNFLMFSIEATTIADV